MLSIKNGQDSHTSNIELAPRLRCNIIREALYDIDFRSELVVLDVGAAASSSVKFFSEKKTRLFFPDLYNADFITGTQPDLPKSDLVSLFRLAMSITPDLQLDYCFFWDIFSFLKRPYILALLEALRPHLSEKTRGYCIGNMHGLDMPNCHYGIADTCELTQANRHGASLKTYAHSLSELNSLLKPFVISKNRLLVKGRMEYLLLDSSLSAEPSNAMFR
jgi:hypothetical protein